MRDDLVIRVETEALRGFSGLLPDYHRRMAEAMIHALANWIHEEDVEDVVSDIAFHRGRVEGELEADIHRSRFQRRVARD